MLHPSRRSSFGSSIPNTNRIAYHGIVLASCILTTKLAYSGGKAVVSMVTSFPRPAVASSENATFPICAVLLNNSATEKVSSKGRVPVRSLCTVTPKDQKSTACVYPWRSASSWCSNMSISGGMNPAEPIILCALFAFARPPAILYEGADLRRPDIEFTNWILPLGLPETSWP